MWIHAAEPEINGSTTLIICKECRVLVWCLCIAWACVWGAGCGKCPFHCSVRPAPSTWACPCASSFAGEAEMLEAVWPLCCFHGGCRMAEH